MPGPTDDLPRFIQVFEAVCQTIAYAHSEGVIHRDLKPANVMVGAFGQVQVMDWGLAKVLGEGGSSDEGTYEEHSPSERTIDADRPADSHTQGGSLLGILAYMPPEQARGDISRVDRRADVFALGATLCEILTGRPPYGGAATEALANAEAGHMPEAHARLAECGAPPDLIALARACLAPRPDDRPADGQAVAEAVTAHRCGVEERVMRAEVERAEAKAKAAERRKRRRTQFALAATILLLVTGAVVVALGTH